MSKLNVFLGIIGAFVFFSCSTTVGNQEHKVTKEKQGTEISKKEERTTTKPEHLSLESFKEKVWNFEESPEEWKYKGETPCVIDFYADWCKPCKMVAPIMDEMSKKYEGKVKIYKINTDKERELASVFRIRSIPAVLFVPMKGKPSMQTGALPRDRYIEIIDKELLKK
jgi:thioredoxin